MEDQSLQRFVSELTGESHLRVEHDYGGGFVRLHTSEAERRQAAQDIQCSEQIVLELLRNSRDAHATHIFVASSKDGDKRRITVIDDGMGIPASMHQTVFEPRVTSKLNTSHMDAWGLHGRGMALFSIAQNTEYARVECSQPKLGCALTVVSDVTRLREKKDQSTFPRFILDEESTVNIRGPKNILRTSCEFAIDARDECTVFFGSQGEIAAALIAYGASSLSAVDRAFCKDIQALPITKRLALASDSIELSQLAAQCGLIISSRTARRILDGEIDDALPLLDRIEIEREATQEGKERKRRQRQQKGVKIGKQDLAAMKSAVSAEYEEIAERYYLEANVEPHVRTSKGKLVISVPLVPRQ